MPIAVVVVKDSRDFRAAVQAGTTEVEVAAMAVDTSNGVGDGVGAGTRRRTTEEGGVVGGTGGGAGATTGSSVGEEAEAVVAAPAGARVGAGGKGAVVAVAPLTGGGEKAREDAGGALPAEGGSLLEAGKAISAVGMAGHLERGPPSLAAAALGRRRRGALGGGGAEAEAARSGTSMMTTRYLEGRMRRSRRRGGRLERAAKGGGLRGRLQHRTG